MILLEDEVGNLDAEFCLTTDAERSNDEVVEVKVAPDEVAHESEAEKPPVAAASAIFVDDVIACAPVDLDGVITFGCECVWDLKLDPSVEDDGAVKTRVKWHFQKQCE